MIAMIAAVDANNGIGYNNNLLFHNKEDMQHFRNVTLGKTVVMGRKTAQSLPRGFLPHRNNLILSFSPERVNIVLMDSSSGLQGTVLRILSVSIVALWLLVVVLCTNSLCRMLIKST